MFALQGIVSLICSLLIMLMIQNCFSNIAKIVMHWNMVIASHCTKTTRQAQWIFEPFKNIAAGDQEADDKNWNCPNIRIHHAEELRITNTILLSFFAPPNPLSSSSSPSRYTTGLDSSAAAKRSGNLRKRSTGHEERAWTYIYRPLPTFFLPQ